MMVDLDKLTIALDGIDDADPAEARGLVEIRAALAELAVLRTLAAAVLAEGHAPWRGHCKRCDGLAAWYEVTGQQATPVTPLGRDATTVRRSCTCGAAETFTGRTPVVQGLLAAWDNAHSGPGHRPSTRPPSEDGRTPRVRPSRARRPR